MSNVVARESGFLSCANVARFEKDEELIAGMLANDAAAWRAFQAKFDRLIIRCVTKVTRRFASMISPDDVREEEPTLFDDTLGGTALVVRVGGGRAGERFALAAERTLIGRSPECDVFLDDVTVSRRHAELLQSGERFTIRDLGSLNGTFVNRHRVESVDLHDDDEVQVGKYRLTFLQR